MSPGRSRMRRGGVSEGGKAATPPLARFEQESSGESGSRLQVTSSGAIVPAGQSPAASVGSGMAGSLTMVAGPVSSRRPRRAAISSARRKKASSMPWDCTAMPIRVPPARRMPPLLP
ncbi:hypothetical protein D3C87_1337690 [compost metagenome]